MTNYAVVINNGLGVHGSVLTVVQLENLLKVSSGFTYLVNVANIS